MDTARSLYRRSLVAVAAGALLALGASPARAVVAAAGPGAFTAGYATPVVVVPDGAPLTFANADLADHTLTSDAKLPRRIAKKTAYCKTYGVRSCPVFTTPDVSTGESAEVRGLKNASPGRLYEFACRIHSRMRGTLVVAGVPSSP